MNDFSSQVRRILDEADGRLRSTIAEAATAGDLSGVDVARETAGRIREILISLDAAGPASFKHDSGTPRQRTKSRTRAKTRKGNKSDYPKFCVRNGSLVRIGWSKKKKQEYEHKVAQPVFDRTLEALFTLSQTRGKLISVDQINGAVEGQGAASVPSYQIYVVLGVLRTHKCVEQVGREGYRILPDFKVKARNIWATLLEK